MHSFDWAVVANNRNHQYIVVVGVLVAVEEVHLDILEDRHGEHYVVLEVDCRTLAAVARYDDQACREAQVHFLNQVFPEIQVEL